MSEFRGKAYNNNVIVMLGGVIFSRLIAERGQRRQEMHENLPTKSSTAEINVWGIREATATPGFLIPDSEGSGKAGKEMLLFHSY